MGDLVNKAADIIASKVSGPGMHRSERLKANHRLDQIEAARAIIAICQAEAADEIARLREALGVADAAIKEWFRYLHGGEMRGSYDGKPEREQLRKAGYVTTAALQHKDPHG